MSSNKGWKYGMIVVEIDDDGEETCELVELYNLEGEGYNSFCRARIMSPEELARAAADVERDGTNSWFFMNGDFEWKFEDLIGWSWYCKPFNGEE